jgi:hypothetical protein
MNVHICEHAAADHPPSRNMVPIGPDFRHVSKKTGIEQCEHRPHPRLGSPVEKAERELTKPCVPSLDNERAGIFDLHEEKSLTAFRMLMKVGTELGR